MIRGSRLPLAVMAVLVVSSFGCRASDEDCRELALHVVELAKAEAEGEAGVGTAVALEQECKEMRPSRGLVVCMVSAQTRAELDDC